MSKVLTVFIPGNITTDANGRWLTEWADDIQDFWPQARRAMSNVNNRCEPLRIRCSGDSMLEVCLLYSYQSETSGHLRTLLGYLEKAQALSIRSGSCDHAPGIQSNALKKREGLSFRTAKDLKFRCLCSRNVFG